MTAGPHVRRAAAANESFFSCIWRWVRTTFWSVFLGQSEWDRICGPTGAVNEQDRMVRFRTTVALSSELVTTCNIVFDFEPFAVEPVLETIAKRSKLKTGNQMLMTNVRSCLQRCSFTNRVYAKAHALRDEAYSSSNDQHETMLEKLWENLKPGVRRDGGRLTKEWGEIGFQGVDPKSDFRGMGYLALIQLHHFTGQYPVEAQRALAESNHPTRWYPFSVTGINITGFVVELIQERLVDFRLYEHAVLQSSDEQQAVERGLLVLHELYCDIFTRFNTLWVVRNPRDVMAFPTIFQELKTAIRLECTHRSFKY